MLHTMAGLLRSSVCAPHVQCAIGRDSHAVRRAGAHLADGRLECSQELWAQDIYFVAVAAPPVGAIPKAEHCPMASHEEGVVLPSRNVRDSLVQREALRLGEVPARHTLRIVRVSELVTLPRMATAPRPHCTIH